jgi:FkbM family methyltransferase
MSYSQFDEEKHILAALGCQHWKTIYDLGSDPNMQRTALVGAGAYLDIGAYHPTDKSNTRALYERGWSGVMIEPSPMPFDTLLREYGNDERVTLICAAVGFECGLTTIHATADAVSTTVDAEYELWKERGGYYGHFLTPQITLEQISNQFGGFEFVNFDAEGISVDLFRRAMELGWRPRCCCVEIDGRMGELAAVATSHGYKIVYANGTNAVMTL